MGTRSRNLELLNPAGCCGHAYDRKEERGVPHVAGDDSGREIADRNRFAVKEAVLLARPCAFDARIIRQQTLFEKDAMTTANMSDPSKMTGADVYDGDGRSIGRIDAIYFDNETDTPEWAAVRTGLFGRHVSLVPLERGNWDGSALTVPFDKEALKAAPHHDPGTELSEAEEQDLYRHYGMPTERSADPRHDRAGEPGVQGRDTSGPTTDDAMTRSEERMRVGTEQHESGRARLRKYVVSENVSTTVPVSHEEVTLEREPITEANRGDAMTGGELTEEEHEVTLTEQRAVADKETVPVERVRLGTETVTENEQVQGTVRKEQIDQVEVDGAAGERGTRGENKN
jgi:uncharacterized protein (TIGR02271 family)